jgi:hypothetical protein
LAIVALGPLAAVLLRHVVIHLPVNVANAAVETVCRSQAKLERSRVRVTSNVQGRSAQVDAVVGPATLPLYCDAIDCKNRSLESSPSLDECKHVVRNSKQ